MTENLYITGLNIQSSLGQAPTYRTAKVFDKEISLPYFAICEKKLNLDDLLLKIDETVRNTLKSARLPEILIHTIPIFIGSTSYSMANTELIYEENQRQDNLYTLTHISDYWQKKYNNNNVFCYSTACTSSANALISAQNMLYQHWADMAIVLSFESFNHLTLNNFHALGLLKETPDYLPFQESGFILGECFSAILIQRGQSLSPLKLYPSICQTDTQDFLQTQKDTLNHTLQTLLKQNQLSASLIQGIKASANGGHSDMVELEVIQNNFPHVFIGFLKHLIGHTLGASAIAESVLFCQALLQGKWLYKLPKINNPSFIQENTILKSGFYILNYIGFGGSQSALLIEFCP